MQIDIIIPTYNNAACIEETLAAVQNQDNIADTVRIIVADDGSSDDTVGIVRRLSSSSSYPVIVLIGLHVGAAAARNRALKVATANIVFLLGADIILRPGALTTHIAFHQANPKPTAAALGWVVWDPRLHPTPLMEYMVHGGPQNNYDALLGCEQADPRHYFNGAHVSLKRELLQHEQFSESFSGYGWEDLDLGRRLAHRGLTLTVLPGAVALHNHHYDSRSVTRRQLAAGRSLRDYQNLHPAIPLLPQRPKYHRVLLRVIVHSGLYGFLLLLREVVSRNWAVPKLFAVSTSLDLWTGIYSSKSNKKA